MPTKSSGRTTIGLSIYSNCRAFNSGTQLLFSEQDRFEDLDFLEEILQVKEDIDFTQDLQKLKEFRSLFQLQIDSTIHQIK